MLTHPSVRPGKETANMPPQPTTLKIRDVTVKLHHAGRGPTVLFLHGAGGVPQWLPAATARPRSRERKDLQHLDSPPMMPAASRITYP
jgi:hypothetical protein